MKIGLCGFIGCGKDTVAEMLIEELSLRGYDFQHEKYASLLKETTASIFGDDFDQRDIKELAVPLTTELHGRILNKSCSCLQILGFDTDQINKCIAKLDAYLTSNLDGGISPRQYQQYFGTDIVRATDPDAWVKYLKVKDVSAIVSDIRFPNELCDFNIYVLRDGTRTSNHVSEDYAAFLLEEIRTAHPLDFTVDYIIRNATDLEGLKGSVHQLVDYLIYKILTPTR